MSGPLVAVSGKPLTEVHRLLIAVVSLVVGQRLQARRLGNMAHRRSCPEAHGLFLDQGLNL